MSNRYRYDYYTVSVPGDMADDINALANHAIDEARERTKLYCMPATWTATLVSGNVGSWEVTFRVTRKRCR